MTGCEGMKQQGERAEQPREAVGDQRRTCDDPGGAGTRRREAGDGAGEPVRVGRKIKGGDRSDEARQDPPVRKSRPLRRDERPQGRDEGRAAEQQRGRFVDSPGDRREARRRTVGSDESEALTPSGGIEGLTSHRLFERVGHVGILWASPRKSRVPSPHRRLPHRRLPHRRSPPCCAPRNRSAASKSERAFPARVGPTRLPRGPGGRLRLRVS